MAIVERKVEVDIVKGPGLDVLLDSIKYAFSGDAQVNPRFTSMHGNVYSASITGLEHTDHSRAIVAIKGSLCYTDSKDSHVADFTGTYSTESRKGEFSFTVKFETESATASEEELRELNNLALCFDCSLGKP